VSLEHTLFLDFLKLFLNMRLIVSFVGKKKTHFLDLRIKSYGCLKFQGEVWAGRACTAANEKELTTCAKRGGQEEKKFKKNGNSPTGPGINPQPAGDRRLTPGPIRLSQFFEIFLFLKNEFLKVWEMGQGFWENGCTAPPFFEACPYTWKC
jgi:hypothetical protein